MSQGATTLRAHGHAAHATAILAEEHVTIRKGLEVLRAMADRAARGEPVSHESASRLIEFFRGFADGCHHAKEEGVLFTVLEETGEAGADGQIEALLREHDRARSTLRELATLTADLDRTSEARHRFVDLARDYATLLEGHIDSETAGLFPLVDRLLPAALQRQVLEGFERHERQGVGPGAHERYQGILDDLTRELGVETLRSRPQDEESYE